MAMWYWSADTLFWQLPIDHDMDVQYQRWKLMLTITLKLFLEYGRHVGATSLSSLGCARLRTMPLAMMTMKNQKHWSVNFLWVWGSKTWLLCVLFSLFGIKYSSVFMYTRLWLSLYIRASLFFFLKVWTENILKTGLLAKALQHGYLKTNFIRFLISLFVEHEKSFDKEQLQVLKRFWSLSNETIWRTNNRRFGLASTHKTQKSSDLRLLL